jgi:hypothetical protein
MLTIGSGCSDVKNAKGEHVPAETPVALTVEEIHQISNPDLQREIR